MRKNLGIVLVTVSIMIAAMAFFDRVPARFAWIYHWGDVGAWAITATLLVVGLLLLWNPAKPRE